MLEDVRAIWHKGTDEIPVTILKIGYDSTDNDFMLLLKDEQGYLFRLFVSSTEENGSCIQIID